MQRWLTLADGLVITLAAVAIGALYAVLWSPQANGLEVEIWRAGERLQQLSLGEDRRLDIDGSLGSSTIEIKQGQARFVASPCHNKVCILSGWQQHAGDMAACLPNQLSLRIVGRDPRYDAINF